MQMRGLQKTAQIVESGLEIGPPTPRVMLHLSAPFLGRFFSKHYCPVLTRQLSLTHASSLEISGGLSLPRASWLFPKSLQRNSPAPLLWDLTHRENRTMAMQGSIAEPTVPQSG